MAVLQCDLNFDTSLIRPGWKVASSKFLTGRGIVLPAVIDHRAENLGGRSPSFDPMIFCTTFALAENKIQLLIKRMREWKDGACSTFTPEDIVQTQEVNFGGTHIYGKQTYFDYRYYRNSDASWNMRRLFYFGAVSEFPSLSPSVATEKCVALAARLGK